MEIKEYVTEYRGICLFISGFIIEHPAECFYWKWLE